jgi:uncharacterized protein YegL
MEAKHQVHNLIILDESGSMQSIKSAIISGFNELVQTVKGIQQQFPEQEHFISFVTFNSLGHKTLLFQEPIDKLEPLDENKYQPNALTPLYDAIGINCSKLQHNLADSKDFNVLVTILTDGEENDSKEYTGPAIKSLIEELKQKHWTFTYIGTDHDVEKAAASIAINNILIFEKHEKDIQRVFATEKSARRDYRLNIERKINPSTNYYKKGDV